MRDGEAAGVVPDGAVTNESAAADGPRLPLGQQPASPTIYDVARAAGVAIGTASKALNGRGKLRPETRARVQDVADRLDFRPNDLAQSLLRGRSFTVGLITTDSYGRFSIPLITGIEDALGTARISVFLCNAGDDPARERQHIESLLAKQVDGIIVTARRTDPRPPIAIGKAHVPVLYAYAQTTEGNALCLLPDDAQGGYLAAEQLVRAGRRRLAHVTGPERFEAVRLRRDGMRQALAAHGVAIPDERIVAGPWQESWGHEAVAHLLGADRQIDGIFCGSDQIARGVVDALRERGVRVPDDVAVVGFDNWEIIAAATRPPLTTVDMQLHDLGHLAGLRLRAMIDGEREYGVVRLPCRLVTRASCGAAPTGEGRPGEKGAS